MMLLVTLQPDQRASRAILALKRRVRSLVGPQQYLGDEPHVTLYLARFDRVAPVAAALERLSSSGRPVTRLDGWLIFRDDVVTGKQTLTVALKPAEELVRLQGRVVGELGKLRQGIVPRYAHLLKGGDTRTKARLRTYGFPFHGRDWKPHLGIASIKTKDFGRVWNRLVKEPPRGPVALVSLNLYRLSPRQEQLRLLARYPLKVNI